MEREHGGPSKMDALLRLKPDVAIIPESARPATLAAKTAQSMTRMVWIGDQPNNGLGVLSFGDYWVEVCREYDARLEWIAPVVVEGPNPFFLFLHGARTITHLSNTRGNRHDARSNPRPPFTRICSVLAPLWSPMI